MTDSLSTHLKGLLKEQFPLFLPLNLRKQLAVWISRQEWMPGRNELSMAMIRDWADSDIDAFHRFLWSHHVGYANYYEATNDFHRSALLPTRRMLFEALQQCLLRQNMVRLTSVESVLDVGCSAGYLLRFMETCLFPRARTLEGIDIDEYAIENGKAYLNACSSKIRLVCSDVTNLDQVVEHKYDIVLCAGVLMYLNENAAAALVQSMLNHSAGLVVITGLAHPLVDNSQLDHSELRSDRAFIHNIDSMVNAACGTIVYRKWEGAKTFGGQTAYFVFCTP